MLMVEPRHWIAAYQGTPWPTQFRGEAEIRATVTTLSQTEWRAAREGTRLPGIEREEANGFPTLVEADQTAIQATFFSPGSSCTRSGGGWRARWEDDEGSCRTRTIRANNCSLPSRNGQDVEGVRAGAVCVSRFPSSTRAVVSCVR